MSALSRNMPILTIVLVGSLMLSFFFSPSSLAMPPLPSSPIANEPAVFVNLDLVSVPGVDCPGLTSDKGNTAVPPIHEDQLDGCRVYILAEKADFTTGGVRTSKAEVDEGTRLLKLIKSRKFSKEIWLKYPNLRDDQFTYLLKSVNLLGMPRASVESFLGEPDFRTCYRNMIVACGFGDSWIELSYYHDRLVCWRHVKTAGRRPLYGPWETSISGDSAAKAGVAKPTMPRVLPSSGL